MAANAAWPATKNRQGPTKLGRSDAASETTGHANTCHSGRRVLPIVAAARAVVLGPNFSGAKRSFTNVYPPWNRPPVSPN